MGGACVNIHVLVRYTLHGAQSVSVSCKRRVGKNNEPVATVHLCLLKDELKICSPSQMHTSLGFCTFFNTIAGRAEATSYRAAIRTAKGVVDDTGPVAASKSSGLSELARCREKDSERDGHRVIAKKYTLALPIRVTTLKKADGVTYPGDLTVLRLKDWISFIVKHNAWHIFVGLYKADRDRERAILCEFWARYREVMPRHKMWALVDAGQLDLSRCAPLLLHGDEGRGRKRSPFLVLSWHSVLGFGTDAANRCRKFRPYKAMRLNFSESTHVHRLVAGALPKMTHDELALQDLLQVMAEDANMMLKEGVIDDHGTKFFAVCIQACGDWAWLAKSGSFLRSFHNVQKRPLGPRSQPKGICHLCRAGQINVPWENFREFDHQKLPAWHSTMHSQTPWNVASPLCAIPYVDGEEAAFWSFDLFHAYHLGVGKTFVAACLALASETIGASKVDDRLDHLTSIYLTWAEERHDPAYLSAISRGTLGWPDGSTYPNGQWSKGHVTTCLTKFFLDWVQAQDLSDYPLLELCKQAAICISTCPEDLYRSDVWLEKKDAHRIADNGLRFLSLYRELAFKSHQANKALVSLMPKGHALDHLFLSLKISAVNHDYSLSILVTSVQIDEDYIGKVSRLSRRTSAEQSIKRVLQRSLMACFKHWRALGFIREWPVDGHHAGWVWQKRCHGVCMGFKSGR